MTTIFFIRHGESQSNAGLPTPDPKNVELTSRGCEQARHIARFFTSYSPLKLIVTSPYVRTKQTAAPTQAMLRSVPIEEWDVQEFTYLSSMHQEQSTTTERRPLVDAYWEQCQPSYVDGTGSESFVQFIDRVQAFMLRLQDTSYETIAVFGHAQFINAVLWLIDCGWPTEREAVALSPQAMGAFRAFLKRNALLNGTIVQVKVRHQRLSWSYERITEHIQQLEADLPLNPKPHAEQEREWELSLVGTQ